MPPIPGFAPANSPFYSNSPANTAMSVANLYERPLGMPLGLGQLTPDPTRIPFFSSGPANTAAGLEHLYGSFPPPNGVSGMYGPPAGALPPGGSTGIYNNRLLSQAARSRTVPGGTTTAGPVPPFGQLGRGAARTATSAADDVLAAAAGGAEGAAATAPTALSRALGVLRGGGGVAGGAVRGIGGGLAGNLLAQALPGEGPLDSALRGAGMGYAFGPWGALAGGIAGGVSDALNIPVLQDVFGGIEAPEAPDPATLYTDSRSRIESAFTAMGIPSEQRNQFWRGVNASLELAGDDENARLQVVQGLLPAAESVLSTYESQANSGVPRMTPQDIAQIQAMVGMFTQPYAQQYVDTANQAAGFVNAAAENMPPAYRGILQAQAAQQVSSANRYAAALQQQAAVLPSMSAYQMAISQAYQQPQGSAGDLASILAQMPAA